MKKAFAVCLFASASFALVGCGGGDQPKNIMEGVDPAAVQSYEEMVAADEAAMNADPADSEDSE